MLSKSQIAWIWLAYLTTISLMIRIALPQVGVLWSQVAVSQTFSSRLTCNSSAQVNANGITVTRLLMTPCSVLKASGMANPVMLARGTVVGHWCAKAKAMVALGPWLEPLLGDMDAQTPSTQEFGPKFTLLLIGLRIPWPIPQLHLLQ